jgi:hypothetical protein
MRAASHSRRRDTAVQAALDAHADALTALVDYVRFRDAEAAARRVGVATLEALESQRVRSDP